MSINVIVPSKGRHFHLNGECAGLWQGWMNSKHADRSVWAPEVLTIDEAELAGKFACRRCYAQAGMVIPAALDRIRMTAARREARALLKSLTV